VEEDTGLGSRLALRQSAFRGQLAEQLHADKQDKQIVQLPNHWNERWNQLDRTYKVANRATRDQFGVPRYSGVPQS